MAADNFLERAQLLISRNIPTVPVNAGEKRTTLQDWPILGTTDAKQVAQWNTINAAYNTAAVCLPDGICVLDADSPELEKLHPQPPDTFTVRSAGKRLPHFYFRQTDRSRSLGNRSAAGLFDFQQNRKYVVGPGSVLADGRSYDIVNAAELAPLPDWLADFIEAHSTGDKPRDLKAQHVSNDFDIDAMLTHYGLSYDTDGDLHITDVCPVAGRKHEQSTRTGFIFDGTHLGFHCFAQDCDGSRMTAGQVISHLNKSHAPYAGAIWEGWEGPDVRDMMAGHLGEGGIIYRDEAAYKSAVEEWAADWRALFHSRAETENAPPLEFLVENFLQKDSITMLGGPPAAMKTYVALSVAKALITGDHLFGFLPVTQRVDKVLYFVPESALGPFAARLQKLDMVKYVGNQFFYRTLDKGEVIKLTDERIKVAVRDSVVFLDTAVRFMEGDENSSADQRAFAQNLFGLLKAHARGVVGLHHAPKQFSSQNQMILENVLRGSGDIGAMLATCWGLAKIDADLSKVYLKCVKDRDFSTTPQPFIIQGRPHLDEVGEFLVVENPAKEFSHYRQSAKGKQGGAPTKVTDIRTARIVEMRDRGSTLEAIAAAEGISVKTVQRTLAGQSARQTGHGSDIAMSKA